MFNPLSKNQNLDIKITSLFVLTILIPVFNIPYWADIIVISLLSWHIYRLYLDNTRFKNVNIIYNKKYDKKASMVFNTIAVLAFAFIIYRFKSMGVVTASAAHLSIMSTLELNEMRRYKQGIKKHMVICFCLYFILLICFLFYQSIAMPLILFIGTILITNLVIDINHDKQPLPFKKGVLISSKIILLALPLAAIMFVFFPRISIPFLNLNGLVSRAASGLNNTMAPGQISKIATSNRMAFEANFKHNNIPPESKLYWRVYVLNHYNGIRWTQKTHRNDQINHKLRGSNIHYHGQSYTYNITTNSNMKQTLPTLDIPHYSDIPYQMMLQNNLELITDKNKKIGKKVYQLTSSTSYTLQPHISQQDKQQYLQLPKKIDPKARQLAHKWVQEGLSKQQIVQKALHFYKKNNFVYTLSPGRMPGKNNIDEFLFKKRKGFCEHYAGSMAFLMRAANIPTRVVLGFQGGKENQYGHYITVHNSNAHAWDEVWLKGKGWTRVDPTAQASPQRIQNGTLKGSFTNKQAASYYNKVSHSNLSFFQPVFSFTSFLNNQWNQWFLNYNKSKQNNLMSKLGLNNYFVIWCFIIASSLLVFITIIVLSYFLTKKINRITKEKRIWFKTQKKLKQYQQKGETIFDFVNRLTIENDQQHNIIKNIATCYQKIKYKRNTDSEYEQYIKQMKYYYNKL